MTLRLRSVLTAEQWKSLQDRNAAARTLKGARREGVGKDGTPRKPPMAFGWYKNINDADMKALIAYLRSMKPVPFAGKS